MNANPNHFRKPSWSRLRWVVLALSLASTTGCGQQYADVSGKVSFQGRPVMYGTVSIIASDQMTYYAIIQLDGTYTAVGVPVGPVKVGVYSPDPYFELPVPAAVKLKIEQSRRESGVPQMPKPPKGKWVRLPPKYADPLTSGINAEVAPLATVIDVRLD